jgi:hypothetical protein
MKELLQGQLIDKQAQVIQLKLLVVQLQVSIIIQEMVMTMVILVILTIIQFKTLKNLIKMKMKLIKKIQILVIL